MVSSWLPRRFRPRNLGYLSLALLSGENDSDDDYDEKDCSREGSFHDNDDDDDDRASVTETLVGGSSPIESGLLADNFDEKVRYSVRKPSRRQRVVATLKKLNVLLPSFLVPDDKPAARLHPSAWLDGLRGWAAFLVVWHHASLLYFSWLMHDGYRMGDNPDDPMHQYVIQMPIIRLLIAGPPQVKIFFVISGFALSYKPLKLAHAGRYNEWASALNSSVFRRWPRLFMPAIVVLLMGTLLGYNKYYGGSNGEDKWNDGAAVMTRPPPVKEELSEQLWDLWGNILKASNPFSSDERRSGTPYDWNLWTLAMEFDCSMVLFLCLAAFARIRTVPRLLLTASVASYCLWWTHWPPFLFISGMLLCDLHFTFENWNRPAALLPSQAGPRLVSPLRQQNTRLMRAKRVALVFCHHGKRLACAIPTYLPAPVQAAGAAAIGNPHAARLSRASFNAYERVSSSGVSRGVHNRVRGLRAALLSGSLWSGLLSLAGLATALFLLSFPAKGDRGGDKTPYYGWIIRDYTPRHYEHDNDNNWWLSLGAVLLVFVLDRTPWMQRPFTLRFTQYLGRISYALYLVHGPILFSAGWHIGRWTTGHTGRETERQYGLGIALAFGMLWPLLIWAADLACRLIDEKSVVFAKWSYDSLTKKDE